MRILILTQWFTPEPDLKGLPFARELMKLGHEVQVLTGFPNYPGGKLYKGYRIRFYQKELIDGVSVIRVPLYPSHDSSALGRIANYLSFAISAAILGTILIRRAEVMYVYHPPATIGLPAVLISIIRRIPFVYDIQDLWPDTLSSTGMLNNNKILNLINIWCNFVYRRASQIVVLSNGFKDALIKRGVSNNKIHVIYNWCDEQQAQWVPVDEKQPAFEDKFTILFAGTMGKAQGLDAVLEAARLILSRQPNIQFVFIGGGVEVSRLKQKAKDSGLINVLFLPRRSASEIGSVLCQADVLLVHLKSLPLFKITVPSKTQTYLAVGRPILMAVEGDAARLIEVSKAGLTCRPENPADIADKIEQFYALSREALLEMGVNGKAFYQRELSLEIGTRKMEKIFVDVQKIS